MKLIERDEFVTCRSERGDDALKDLCHFCAVSMPVVQDDDTAGRGLFECLLNAPI